MPSSPTALPSDRSWSEEAHQLEDFSRRWQAARLSALKTVIGEDLFSESDALSALQTESIDKQEAAKRAVFHVGGLLASGMTRYFRHLWTPREAAHLISSAGIPCFRGKWTQPDGAESYKIQRPGCEHGHASFLCEYWREAADGFITGLSDKFFYARHASISAGNTECRDWIYTARDAHLKFGAVPEAQEKIAIELNNLLAKDKVHFEAVGFSENTLYYRMDSEEAAFCGPGKRLFEDFAKNRFKKVFPDIKFFDVTPRPVLREGA